MDENDREEILVLKRKVEMMSNMYAEVMRSKTKIDELEQKVQECPCSVTHKRKNRSCLLYQLHIVIRMVLSVNILKHPF